MFPSKLGAKDEEEGGTPALLVAAGKVKSKMPPKLGADAADEEDTSEEEVNPKQAMQDSAAKIAALLGGSKTVAKQLSAALESHCRAVYELLENENGEP